MKYIQEIGMRAHDLPTHTPSELKEYAEKLNIKYVQLALRKSFTNINWTNDSFSVGLAAKIREELGDLRISVLGSYVNLLAEGEELEEAKAVFRQNMLFAKYLNAGVIGTETGTGVSSHTEEDYLHVLAVVKELAAEAEKLGVIIAIEGVHVHTINTPEMMKRLLDDVNSPNVMTIFDPVNYINIDNYENQDEIIRNSFELLKNKMTAVHLKDFKVVDGRLVGERVGCGLLNMKLLFECIQKYKPHMDVLLEESSEEKLDGDRAAALACMN